MRVSLLLLALLATPALAVETVVVTPSCFIGPEQVALHVLVTTRTSTNRTYRSVFSLTCTRQTKQCTGVKLLLASLEDRNTVEYSDMLSLAGATLLKSSANSAIIEWGVWTLTLNTVTGKVSVATESGDSKGSESGEGPCR